jgi:hypothetical protein
MHAIWLCLVSVLVSGQVSGDSPAQQPTGGEWPAYKGNAGLTGLSRDDSIKPPFKLDWSYRPLRHVSTDRGPYPVGYAK